MIYQYQVTHSHGEASGSVEAESPAQAEQMVRDMYHDQEFSTKVKTAVRLETTDVLSVTVTEVQ